MQVNTSRIVENVGSLRDLSYRRSRSNSELYDDSFFDTSKVLYQEKAIQKETQNLGARETNELFYVIENPFLSNNPSPKKIR